jgi:hypothetical protein
MISVSILKQQRDLIISYKDGIRFSDPHMPYIMDVYTPSFGEKLMMDMVVAAIDKVIEEIGGSE